jgi:hypothetical protein
VANSILPLDWGPNTVMDAAVYWTRYLSFGLAMEKYNPDATLCVRYEDLLLQPEETLSRIAGFLGIGFDAAMLTSNDFFLPNYTRSQHHAVGKPIDVSKIDRWKENFLPRQVELFEFYTDELLRYLDYQPLFPNPVGPTTTEKIAEVVRKRIAYSWNRIRFRTRLKSAIRNNDYDRHLVQA